MRQRVPSSSYWTDGSFLGSRVSRQVSQSPSRIQVIDPYVGAVSEFLSIDPTTPENPCNSRTRGLIQVGIISRPAPITSRKRISACRGPLLADSSMDLV